MNEAFRSQDEYGSARSRAGTTPIPRPVRAALDLLKLSHPCTMAEIKAAYRVAAKHAHPDQGGTTADMARLNEAKEILDAYFSA